MPELKIPFPATPFFAASRPPQEKPASAVPQDALDVGTKALVDRLQEKLDATFAEKSAPIPNISALDVDAEVDARVSQMRGALSSFEKQTRDTITKMSADQVEQVRVLREAIAEQLAKNRPRKIKAPSGKIYEVIE